MRKQPHERMAKWSAEPQRRQIYWDWRAVPAKRVDDLTNTTAQGIWEAHLKGELAEADAVDRAAVNAAGVLAGRGHWTWIFQAATEDLTSWRDLDWNNWVVDPYKGYIWDWDEL